jgi:hypothetical protein
MFFHQHDTTAQPVTPIMWNAMFFLQHMRSCDKNDVTRPFAQ